MEKKFSCGFVNFSHICGDPWKLSLLAVENCVEVVDNFPYLHSYAILWKPISVAGRPRNSLETQGWVAIGSILRSKPDRGIYGAYNPLTEPHPHGTLFLPYD